MRDAGDLVIHPHDVPIVAHTHDDAVAVVVPEMGRGC